ncbi:hypothetical protein KIN20_006390 [Parelaphostrongylus tenuis]|uniref:Uncharacterized protein n=1 Tax=Parelaphostrongylus tenuis TaxID=148309 RepID=A0AAD5MKA5_PARTN|nr:hypothetical protein KIN20_006390 [Parelaphostrongylus tenuis]
MMLPTLTMTEAISAIYTSFSGTLMTTNIIMAKLVERDVAKCSEQSVSNVGSWSVCNALRSGICKC